MNTFKTSIAEHFADRPTTKAGSPPCEKCGSKQVELGVTTLDFGQPTGFASGSVVQGQWLHCVQCDHRWFVSDTAAADTIQAAENYLLSLEDNESQNPELRKLARILRMLSERVRVNDAIVAQFMQERP